LHLYEKRKRIRNRGLLIGIAVFVVVIIIFTISLSGFMQKIDARETAMIEDAIRRAVVTCYAIEGRYPESFAYLCDNYGVIVDGNRYHIYYEVFARNIMPAISVYRKGGKP